MKKAAISFADERAIGQGASAVFLAMVLTLAGCFPMVEGDGFNAEDWKWDAGGGKVYIRIDLNASRFAVDLDNPTQDHAVYFEAVFKEEGTTNYYTGAAAAGEGYITVAVPYGKTYDISLLAGYPANGSVSNGVKVLLASGFVRYPIIYGQNAVSVPMTLHKTADTLAWDESTGQFTYKLSVQGVGALRLAQPNGDLLYDAAPRAYLIPYPDVYSAAHQRPPITVSEGTGSLILTIKDSLPDAAKKGVLYQCYYNLTYYAFSDPDSGSSPWNIRRGITNQMYTQDTSYGGGIPISSCYYASATGSDANAGYLKEQPFKTLAKAVKAVREKNIPWIKTIAVLGELNWASESSAYYPGYQANANVFVIPDLQAGESAADLIRITGDPAFTGGVPAVLSGATGRRVLYIYGANTKIQFDHIEITRGNLTENAHGGGMWIGNGAQVSLKAFSQINGNEASSAGGVWIESGGKLTLSENADIHHNKAKGLGYGGGVYMMNTGTAVPSLTMNGGTIRNNTALGGGGVNVNNGWFSMSNGSVRDNTVQPADGSRTQFGGGGVRIESGGLFYMTGGSLIDNMADGQRENVGYKSGANNYTDINADGYSTSGYNLVITDNIP